MDSGPAPGGDLNGLGWVGIVVGGLGTLVGAGGLIDRLLKRRDKAADDHRTETAEQGRARRVVEVEDDEKLWKRMTETIAKLDAEVDDLRREAKDDRAAWNHEREVLAEEGRRRDQGRAEMAGRVLLLEDLCRRQGWDVPPPPSLSGSWVHPALPAKEDHK